MAGTGERHQTRIGALARQRGMATDLLLARFCMERFLARLSRSAHRDRFALKGALLMAVWHGDMLRATADIDLHGLEEADSGSMLEIVGAVCSTPPPEDDGIVFDPAGATGTRLLRGRVEGDRVSVPLAFGRARMRLKVDAGFGHPVTPGYEKRWFPSLLPGFAQVPVTCYPRETAIAEKLAAAVEFGQDSTRLRDYWDIRELSARYRYSGHALVEAVRTTFASREAGSFLARDGDYWMGALRPEFATPERCRLWQSWSRAHVRSTNGPFQETLDAVIRFSMPVLDAIRRGTRPPGHWDPSEGWSAMGPPGGRPPLPMGSSVVGGE